MLCTDRQGLSFLISKFNGSFDLTKSLFISLQALIKLTTFRRILEDIKQTERDVYSIFKLTNRS